ncbi:putative DNA-directed RNA polymerase subunit sigma-24 [Brevibacillus phage SecTim467]|uniref:Putative DNA-directed RNA polymerase subunit sigma-24 n=2 Tax=Jenstvirus jenst TaxID=1982225 RepID=A0A0K2CPD2_9CAUD|nr:putative DNA-directed RNA polymerase subunit sigma-24 [Brevibacillus phage Jenst]ALA07269.1 putative DNA-directed RNA polymerase subunit sigma-24 [Brevibacillus phage Jenst]ALA07470.1 putative DNA-directed RNA polymerase subunit sigma-24 [Brevibacillus phage SecTim467]
MQTTVATFDINSLNPILNLCLKDINRRDREDVKQDAIVRVLTVINKGVIKKNLFNCLRTVIQRTVFDYYRKKNRMIVQNSVLVNYSDGADEEKGSTIDTFSHESVEMGYELSEVKNDYLNNISKFTPQQRRVIDFMLFTEEGMDMRPTEISNLLGLDKSHASRAMKMLKQVCQG